MHKHILRLLWKMFEKMFFLGSEQVDMVEMLPVSYQDVFLYH